MVTLGQCEKGQASNLGSKLILVFIVCLTLTACLPEFNYPTEVYMVAKNQHTRHVLPDIQVAVMDTTGQIVQRTKTNDLGFTKLNFPKARTPHQYRIKMWSDTSTYLLADTAIIRLNDFLDWYELSLKVEPQPAFKDLLKTADMHYHLTMKSYNSFAPELNSGNSFYVGSLIELKKSKNLRVLHNGKWTKAPVDRLLTHYEKSDRDKRMLKSLIEGTYVKPKKKNNGVDDYTQATNPHLRDGNVMLAYNSISPFEYNLVRSGFNRYIGSMIKSRARLEWLEQMGKGGDYITHWENFNSEYNYFKSNIHQENSSPWKLFTDPQAEDHKVVLVVEGGHIFQDTLFPHDIRYWIKNTRYHRNKKSELLNRISPQTPDMRITTRMVKQSAQMQEPSSKWYRNEKNNALREFYLTQERHLEDLLMTELETNVLKVKQLRNPKVSMVTVSHLSYNGLFGHAPAIDDATFLGRLLTQRAFRLRVSDDPRYKTKWNGYFFSGLGPTIYGKRVAKLLVDSTYGGTVIQLDMKHCDYLTRKFLMDSIYNDTSIPPICSHCAVTGLSEIFYSPASDEYAFRDSRLVKTLYPFSLNLYDEEIRRIFRKNGIIGLPLEQRVLGGYIDSKQDFKNYRLFQVRKGKRKSKFITKRSKIIQQSIEELRRIEDRDYEDARLYTTENMLLTNFSESSGRKKSKRTHEIICKDYESVEPFLQNLFHIVDQVLTHETSDPQKAFSFICIGSDLDGIIDPIEVCPTASMYPHFRKRLEHFIPIFLKLRLMRDKTIEPNLDIRDTRALFKTYYAQEKRKYFNSRYTVTDALDDIFYYNLERFTENKMYKP